MRQVRCEMSKNYSPLEEYIQTHKFFCTKRWSSIIPCNCGRDKSYLELSSLKLVKRAARELMILLRDKNSPDYKIIEAMDNLETALKVRQDDLTIPR